MNKKLLVVALSLMAGVAFASTETSKNVDTIKKEKLFNYTITKKDKSNNPVYSLGLSFKFDGTSTTSATKLSSVSATKSENFDIHDKGCLMEDKDSLGVTQTAFNKTPEPGVQAMLHIVSEKDSQVKTLIQISDTKYSFKENSTKVSDTCDFSNSLSTTTNVTWLGDIPLNGQQIIPLENSEQIVVTVKEVE